MLVLSRLLDARGAGDRPRPCAPPTAPPSWCVCSVWRRARAGGAQCASVRAGPRPAAPRAGRGVRRGRSPRLAASGGASRPREHDSGERAGAPAARASATADRAGSRMAGHGPGQGDRRQGCRESGPRHGAKSSRFPGPDDRREGTWASEYGVSMVHAPLHLRGLQPVRQDRGRGVAAACLARGAAAAVDSPPPRTCSSAAREARPRRCATSTCRSGSWTTPPSSAKPGRHRPAEGRGLARALGHRARIGGHHRGPSRHA